MPKIITHDQGEDEPRGSHSASQCTADLRFPDARIVAYRHFDDAESRERTFNNYFNSPAVRRLLEVKAAKDIGSAGTKRAEISDFYFIEKPDQTGGETIPKSLVPRQRPTKPVLAQARAQGDIGTTVDDGSQKKRQLGRTIAVVSVEEDDYIGSAGIRDSGQTGLTVSATRFAEDAGSHLCGDFGSAVGGIAVYNQDFSDNIGREIGQDAANGLRFIVGRNDDRHSHLIFTRVTRLKSTRSSHHHGEDGERRASRESTPHARPARPTASPSDAITGTSSSQIHAVPHSDTQRLPR